MWHQIRCKISRHCGGHRRKTQPDHRASDIARDSLTPCQEESARGPPGSESDRIPFDEIERDDSLRAHAYFKPTVFRSERGHSPPIRCRTNILRNHLCKYLLLLRKTWAELPPEPPFTDW